MWASWNRRKAFISDFILLPLYGDHNYLGCQNGRSLCLCFDFINSWKTLDQTKNDWKWWLNREKLKAPTIGGWFKDRLYFKFLRNAKRWVKATYHHWTKYGWKIDLYQINSHYHFISPHWLLCPMLTCRNPNHRCNHYSSWCFRFIIERYFDFHGWNARSILHDQNSDSKVPLDHRWTGKRYIYNRRIWSRLGHRQIHCRKHWLFWIVCNPFSWDDFDGEANLRCQKLLCDCDLYRRQTEYAL